MNVLLPTTPQEVFAALGRDGARIFSGGTDLFVRLRAEGGRERPGTLVGLERVEALRGVSLEGGLVRIGAAETHAALLENRLVRARLPLLRAALSVLGGPAVRAMGTIGGNVCTASPAGDSLPPLYAHGAEVELWSERGARRLPLAGFITGPGRTRLEPGEILAALLVPEARGFDVVRFEKVGLRSALAISVVSLAVLARRDSSGRVAEARLAVGSAGPTVLRQPEAETLLAGRRLTLSALGPVAAALRRGVSPIDDLRATAAYRRQVAGNLVLRLALHG